MSMFRKLLCTTAALLGTAGVALAQTNPTPLTVTLPSCIDFGAAGSTTAPAGFAAWNGLNGGTISSQAQAENSTPTNNATISTAQPGSGGGVHYYVPTATPGNARLAVVTSSNATNGVNQWAFALNTTGISQQITIDYDLIVVTGGDRTLGVVSQYRVGTTGAWTTLSGVNNPYQQTPGATVGTVTHATVTLPAAASNQPVVQVRFAVWRGTAGSTSSAFGIDNVCFSAAAANGACCSTNGGCSDVANSSACVGGTFLAGQVCSASPCPLPTGACCLPTGACQDMTQTSCNGTANAIWQGAGILCSANPCPFGACCAPNGTCAVRLSAGCETNQGGFFNGPGSVCTGSGAVTCPNITGACCNPNSGACTTTNNSSLCTSAGNNFQGAGSTCATVTCPQPVGACCTGATCSVGAITACTANNFLGAGSTCATGICNAVTSVVISQVYGGGGSPTSAVLNDYIELFNRSAAPVDLTGWSVQYASATGAGGFQVTPLSGTIQPGRYFLVHEAAGTAGTTPPAADATGEISMAAGGGKVALVRTTLALSAGCPTGASIVDFVGYGNANCFEGAAATPAPSATLSVFRAGGGCTDTGQNGNDFTTGAPATRNSASPANNCPTGTPPTVSTVNVTPSPTCPGAQVTVSVTITPGTGTITSVTGDFTAVGGGATDALTLSSGTTYSRTVTVPVATTLGNKNVPITVNTTDVPGSGVATISVQSCDPAIASGTGASPDAVCNGSPTTLTVVVTPGQNPASASFTVTADLSSIGGTNPATFNQVNATTYSLVVSPAVGTPSGAKSLAITVTDNLNRTDTGTIDLITAPCANAASDVVISQVYGGGGNTGALFQNDFVELFNRSSAPVSVNGWSVQYGSSTDAGNTGPFGSGNLGNNPVALTGTIPAGGYYLVALSNGGTSNGAALPTADATGTINMNASAGRVVLVRNSTAPLNTAGVSDCSSPLIADLVGYGDGSSCYEGDVGTGPTIAPSNSTAIFRRNNGCTDTNYNRLDFTAADPGPRNSSSPINLCGSVTPTGACCLAGNDCQIRTQANCIGGVYQGDNVSCGPTNPCAPATVVCCRGSTCDIVASGSCTVVSGSQAGVSSSAGNACNPAGNTTGPCCKADYNKMNNVDLLDIFAFLNDWFGAKPYADFNGQNNVDLLDIFAFLTAWFAGPC